MTPKQPYTLLPHKVFRETPDVVFRDITVPESNAQDLVVHSGPATSPPDDPKTGAKQFYVHYHQTDNNRVLSGERTFELINFSWENPYQVVYLTPDSGALVIPPCTYHRSISGPNGSMLINQAIRDNENFNPDYEFKPVSSAEDWLLMEALSRGFKVVKTAN